MEKHELEIRVTDILASFLKSIVLIAVITVFFAGLLGGYGYYKAKKAKVSVAYQETVDAAAEKVAAKEVTIKNLEQKNATINEVSIPYYNRKIERDRVLNEKRRYYLENSIYYTIDPFNCGTARITFAVDAPIPDGAAEEYANYKMNEQRRIVNACASMYPFSDEILEKVKTILGSDADKRYIQELIRVTNVEDQFVRLDVYYTDLDLAKKAADYLYSEMVKILKGLDSSYQVTIVNSFTGYEVNREMYEDRTSYEDSILASERALTTDSDALNNLNKNIEDNMTNLGVAKEDLTALKRELASAQSSLANANATRSPKKNVIKFGIIGGFLGLFMALAFVYVRDIFSGKIRSRNNLLSRFPYPLLGVAPASKRIFFDKTIKNLEGDPTYDNKAVVEATVANTLAIASKEGSNCCMIGTIDPSDPALTALKDAMKGKIDYSGNILSDAKTVKSIEKYDSVVLVEKRGTSRADSVSEEITKLKSLQKEIVGVILV
ncbi:MAG: hypothetical protein J6Y58_07805 [Clostridiales bacterium]|nr:hypothetical protein [Clostridiales bacterium]